MCVYIYIYIYTCMNANFVEHKTLTKKLASPICIHFLFILLAQNCVRNRNYAGASFVLLLNNSNFLRPILLNLIVNALKTLGF